MPEGDPGLSAGRADRREGRGTGMLSAVPSALTVTLVYMYDFWKSRSNLVDENCMSMSSVKF